MMRTARLAAGLSLLAVFLPQASAQAGELCDQIKELVARPESISTESALALVTSLSEASGERGKVGITEELEKLKSCRVAPDLLNTLAVSRVVPGGIRDVIDALGLQFKYFDTLDRGALDGLGFEYGYDRALTNVTLRPESEAPLGLDFALELRGNVAFDASQNPADFLQSGVRFDLFQHRGLLRDIAADRIEWTEQDGADLQALVLELAQLDDDELDENPKWVAFRDKLRLFLVGELGTEIFWFAAGNVTFESDQKFDARQLAYGASAGVSIRSYDKESGWWRMNLFDWPGRGVRKLLDDQEITWVESSMWPSIQLGFEGIDPKEDGARFAVDPTEKDVYPRLRGEIVHKTFLADLLGQDTWLSVGYRYFQEIGASKLIRQADLDDYHWFAAAVELENGITMTYSTGKLPFDATKEDVFQIGFKLQFPD